MPSVSEGFAINGQSVAASPGDVNTDGGFNAALARQAQAEAQPPSEPGAAYREAVDQVAASGEEIHAALLSDEPTTDVRSGLTVPAESAPNRWGMSPSEIAEGRERLRQREASGELEAAREATAKTARDAEELARYRSEDATAAALEALEEGDAYERAIAWSRLSLEDRAIAFEDALVAPEEASELDTLAAELFAVSRRDNARREALEAAEAASQDRAARLGQWQKEKLLGRSDTERRYLAALRIAPELGQLSGEDFTKALEVADATVREAQHAERTRLVHEQILAAPSGSVADGIETAESRQAATMERLLDVLDPRPTAPDVRRIVSRSESRPETAEQIREGVTQARDSSYEFEKDGRKMSLDTAFAEARAADDLARLQLGI